MDAELVAAAIGSPVRHGAYDPGVALALLAVVREVAGPEPEPHLEAAQPDTPTTTTTKGSASIRSGLMSPITAPGAAYDLLVPALIPGYASLARLAVSLLAESPLASPSGASILVAGCGTGSELLEARAQRPDWRLTGLDPAAAMLSLAKERLAPGDAIDWLCCKVEDVDKQLSFDGALAVLVLQSLPDDGSKLGFLTALAKLLRPGAQLVLVDLMQPERSPLAEQVARAWQRFQRASGLESESSRRDEALGDAWHPIGTARLNSLLDAAGFGDPALIFQALNFAGYLTQKRS